MGEVCPIPAVPRIGEGSLTDECQQSFSAIFPGQHEETIAQLIQIKFHTLFQWFTAFMNNQKRSNLDES